MRFTETFADVYLWCEVQFLEVEEPLPPLLTPALLQPLRCCPHPISPPVHPPRPWLATGEHSIAKNTQIYNFQKFFQALEIFVVWVLSALGVKEPLLEFDYSLMHIF